MKGRIDMKKRNTFEKLTEIILVLLSVILTAGVKFLFHACGQKEDGSWMHCHDAEQTVFVLGIMLTVMSVLMLIFSEEKKKRWIKIIMIPTALTAVFVPNILIHMCMMKGMRCLSVMRPAVIIISLLIAAAAAVSIYYGRKNKES